MELEKETGGRGKVFVFSIHPSEAERESCLGNCATHQKSVTGGLRTRWFQSRCLQLSQTFLYVMHLRLEEGRFVPTAVPTHGMLQVIRFRWIRRYPRQLQTMFVRVTFR